MLIKSTDFWLFWNVLFFLLPLKCSSQVPGRKFCDKFIWFFTTQKQWNKFHMLMQNSCKIWSLQSERFCCRDLKTVLAALNRNFSSKIQQDVSEFLVLFLHHASKSLPTPLFHNKCESDFIESSTCENCNTSNYNLVTERCIILEMSEVVTDIASLMENFLKRESRKSRCENCNNQETNHRIEKCISSLPEMLIIQLQRCRYSDDGKAIKNLSPVTLKETLDMDFAME